MLYCPNFFWNVLQVWMTGKDVYLQMTWSWPDKTWNILCSYCLQWNTSQSKFRNHYFLFLFAFSILSQLFLIWGCKWLLLLLLYNRSHLLSYTIGLDFVGAACKIWYVICYCVLLSSQGFPLQAEYQNMVNVTSSAGPGLSPSMDYRTGCRNGPTQGLDWNPDYCGNGWADTSKIIQEYTQISAAGMLTCSYLPPQSPAEGQRHVPDLIDMPNPTLLHAHRTKAVPHPSTAFQGLIVQALL